MVSILALKVGRCNSPLDTLVFILEDFDSKKARIG